MHAQLRKQGAYQGFYQNLSMPSGSSITLDVSLVGDYFELLDQETAFARLDKSFCCEARRLVIFGVKFQARLDSKAWDCVKEAWASYETRHDTATFTVDVNIYSLRHHADKIGAMLLRAGIFLQCPAHIGTSEEDCYRNYYNPQILEIEGFQVKVIEDITETGQEEEASAPVLVQSLPVHSNLAPATIPPDHVEQILGSLSHANILREMCTDTNRIKSKLMRKARPICATGYFRANWHHRHQMTALDFVVQRESGKPPAELTLWRQKRLDGKIQYARSIKQFVGLSK